LRAILIVVISVVCSVAIIGVIELLVYGVDSGEEIRSQLGEKIGTEKYALIPQVLSETSSMEENQRFQYIIKNYRDNPAYNEECNRLFTQMKVLPPHDPERLTDDEYRVLINTWKFVCRHSTGDY